jgi:hypothetical protein
MQLQTTSGDSEASMFTRAASALQMRVLFHGVDYGTYPNGAQYNTTYRRTDKSARVEAALESGSESLAVPIGLLGRDGRGHICLADLLRAADELAKEGHGLADPEKATLRLRFVDDGVVIKATDNSSPSRRVIDTSSSNVDPVVGTKTGIALPSFLRRQLAARLDLPKVLADPQALCRHITKFGDQPTAKEARGAFERVRAGKWSACVAVASPALRKACLEEYLSLGADCLGDVASARAEWSRAWREMCAQFTPGSRLSCLEAYLGNPDTDSRDAARQAVLGLRWEACGVAEHAARKTCLERYLRESDISNRSEATSALGALELDACVATASASERVRCLEALPEKYSSHAAMFAPSLMKAVAEYALELSQRVLMATSDGRLADVAEPTGVLETVAARHGTDSLGSDAVGRLAKAFETVAQSAREAIRQLDAAVAGGLVGYLGRWSPLIARTRTTAGKDVDGLKAAVQELELFTVSVDELACHFLLAQATRKTVAIERFAPYFEEVREATNEFERRDRVAAVVPRLKDARERVSRARVFVLQIEGAKAGFAPGIVGEYDFAKGGFPIDVRVSSVSWGRTNSEADVARASLLPDGRCAVRISMPKGTVPILKMPRTIAEQFLKRLADIGARKDIGETMSGRGVDLRYYVAPVGGDAGRSSVTVRLTRLVLLLDGAAVGVMDFPSK